VGYEYDEAGKLLRVKLGAETLREYFYTDCQLSKLKDYRSGASIAEQTFAYDDEGKLTEVAYKGASGGEQEKYTLAYDGSDRITRESIVTSYGPSPVTVVKEYEYDWLGRLVGDTIGGVTTAYTFDDVGNRLTMTTSGDTYAYTYGAYDKLLGIGKNGVEQVSFAYDQNGNQISQTVGGVTTSYIYDEANQLLSVAEGEDQLAEFTYDAKGQRLSKTAGEDTTRYLYDGLDLLCTMVNGEPGEHNILEDDGSIICGLRGASGDKYWYRQDIRGSVTNILNSSDAVVKSYTYDAYGNTEQSGQTFSNSFAYTGAVIDPETGLYYMNARYYDPATGRFINQDSFRGEGEAFWHLYAYCDGDPVNYKDLSGHRQQSIVKNKVDKTGTICIESTVYFESKNTYKGTAIHIIKIKTEIIAEQRGSYVGSGVQIASHDLTFGQNGWIMNEKKRTIKFTYGQTRTSYFRNSARIHVVFPPGSWLPVIPYEGKTYIGASYTVTLKRGKSKWSTVLTNNIHDRI